MPKYFERDSWSGTKKYYISEPNKMGKKPIPISLKATSPEGEIKMFKSIPEAAASLGFSERGVRKAYHEGRSRISEYQLEWLEPEVEVKGNPKVVERIGRTKAALNEPNCSYCGKPLTCKDRVEDGFRIMRLGKDGYPIEEYDIKSLYEAHKLTGLSLHSLTNAADMENITITRRKDKEEFLVSWNKIHDVCLEIR